MRQDVFSVAYREAKSELLDITCKFEVLRQRKDKLESVVAVLGPLFGGKTGTPGVQRRETPPVAAPKPAGGIPIEFDKIDVTAPVPVADITDPFQRRLRDALSFSAPAQDSVTKPV